MKKGEIDRRAMLGLGLAGVAGVALAQNQTAQKSPAIKKEAMPKPTAAPQRTILERASKTSEDLNKVLGGPAESAATLLAQSPATPISFARTGPEKSAWDGVVRALSQVSKLTLDGKSSSEILEYLRRIEKGFSFAAEKEDSDFSPFHIEPLIDQAADLLDRALRDRATWDDLSERWFKTLLEIHEYADLDQIHAEEEVAGVYEIPWKESSATYASDLATSTYNGFGIEVVRGIIENRFGTDEYYQVLNAGRKAAWITGLVPYTWDGQAFAGYANHTYGETTATVADHAADAAETQANHELQKQEKFAWAQQMSFESLKYSAAARMEGSRARRDWDQLNRAFLRRRTMVARKYQDIKSRAATDQDGLLNAGKRLEQLKARFNQDFRDALARLMVVQDGLKNIYGYDSELPKNVDSLEYYDQCLLWTRRALQWLIRFSRQEQNFVMPISVRGLMGDVAWRDARVRGFWTVNLSPDLFRNMAHVRLRGMSAFVEVGQRHDTLWRFSIQPPKSAATTHLSGRTLSLDQSRLPASQLARVSRRDSVREPDIVGVASLHNASPIGTWSIRGLGGMPPVSDFQPLDDIFLELVLTFRAV